MSIIIAGLGNDIHTVAIRLFQIEFAQMQVPAISMGAAVHPDEIIEECKKLQPKVLIISSTNGEFFGWVEELQKLLNLSPRPLIMVGGNLMVEDYNDKEIEENLLKLGFDIVYSRRGTINEICKLAVSYVNE